MTYLRRKMAGVGSIVILVLMIAGCVTAGHDFNEKQVSDIHKGRTTETDLVHMFGAPSDRAVNSDGITILTWKYDQMNMKAATFIPIAGAFLGGTNAKNKFLTVTLDANGKVKDYSSSSGGTETHVVQ